MRIAITAADDNMNSPVFQEFATAPFLLIADDETMSCTPVRHEVSPGSPVNLAKAILEFDCEVVITGRLEEDTFLILADNHVTRYAAAGMTAAQAVAAMERRELQFIRNPEGTDECQTEHEQTGLGDLRCDGHHTH